MKFEEKHPDDWENILHRLITPEDVATLHHVNMITIHELTNGLSCLIP